MKDAKGYCLSCKFYHLQDTATGLCRVDKGGMGSYPQKQIGDQCPLWRDSGQQYFIRVGWIKAQKAASGVEEENQPGNEGETTSSWSLRKDVV